MIFLRSHILGFGKLKDLSLDFRIGLNAVFAGNEGGKSTLQRFLIGMLYGQLRSDLKVQRRLDHWVESYKPWHASTYGGILRCRLTDGRELEVHRFFGKEESRIEIRSSTGEDITAQYEQQRNGEVLFARHHFGMPKELFESVGVIRENRVAEIHGYESIRDRIANLAQSGDEELSIRQSLARLQEALDSIGSERAPTKPYKQTQDLVSALQAEQKALEERRMQFRAWIEDRNRLGAEVMVLERELSRAQANLMSARRRDLSAKVQSLEEIDGQLRNLTAEIELLGACADFPSERLEELNQRVGAQESLAKRLSETRAEKEDALVRLSRAASVRQELAAYASLADGPEAEKITEWFVSYLNVSLQKDGIQKTLARLEEEVGSLKRILSGIHPALSDPAIDWQRMAREAAEDEQIAAQNSAALAEKITEGKADLDAAVRKARNRRILAALLLAVGVGSAAAPLLEELPVAPVAGAVVGFALIVLAGILLFNATKSAETGRDARRMLDHFEAEQKSIRDEGGKKRRRFDEVMADSGFQSMDDFLAAARKSELERQKVSDLQSRLAEAERQRDRLQTQSGELFQFLRDGLAKAGLACSPGNLKFQIDTFRANLRRFRELDAEYGKCAQRAAALTSEDRELTAEFEDNRSRMQSLLEQARVDTPESFRQECRKRQKLMELQEKEASGRREFQRLAGNCTLPQYRDQLQELMRQPEPQCEEESRASESPAESIEEAAPYLPYLPTIAEAEEKERQITSRLFGAREEYARALERVQQAFRNYRSSPEIDEDLAMAERNFRRLETNQLALSTALETILELSREQQEVLAPQLNASVEQRFLRFCGRRYEEVKIDPDFQIWIRELDTGELRLLGHLSRGTQDQLYFALRFGILDLVSNEDEPCPSLLDEPFAAYDRPRLSEAFRILEEESKRRQLILFTCREDLLDLAGQYQAHIIQLPNA